jgi:hypothetical protein
MGAHPKRVPSSLKGWHKKVRWIHVYEIFGEEGLRHGRTRKLSQDQKLEAVRRVLAGESANSVAFSLGMANMRLASQLGQGLSRKGRGWATI